MKKTCIRKKSDGKICKNKRSKKYGDYCGPCGIKGLRDLCKAILPDNKQCPWKAKERGYCGRHKDHGITTIVFMDIESIETHISTPEEVVKKLELEALINEVIEYRNYILSSPTLLKQKK